MLRLSMLCDKRLKTVDGRNLLVRGCLSNDIDADEVFSVSGNNLESLKGAYKYLVNSAKREGWIKHKSNWVCPNCQVNNQ